MKKKRLDNLCRELLDCMEERTAISEEWVHSFIEGLALFDDKDNEMPTSYVRLFDEIIEQWSYREIYQMEAEQIFVSGAIWGCMQLMEAKRKYMLDIDAKEKEWSMLLSKYQDKKSWLKIIHASPGIRHKDFSQKAGKSPSQMTQSIACLVNDKIINCNYAGREKFYFLSEKGERLYKELNEKQRVEKIQNVYSKRLSDDNNENECVVINVRECVNRSVTKNVMNENRLFHEKCNAMIDMENLCRKKISGLSMASYFENMCEVNKEWMRNNSLLMKN